MSFTLLDAQSCQTGASFLRSVYSPLCWFAGHVAVVSRFCWVRRRQRGRISAVTMPSNTSIAPIPGRSFNFSFRTRKAVSHANTGSRVKITAMLAAGITCCAQVCTPNANAVARTPLLTEKSKQAALAGLLPASQVERENPSSPVP